MKIHPFYLISMIFGLLMVVTSAASMSQNLEIEVDAGPHERFNTPVSFVTEGRLAPGQYQMVSPSGDTIHLQVSEDGRGYFILNQLESGETKTFTVYQGNGFDTYGVETVKEGSGLSFRVDGKPVLHYYHRLNNPPEELDDRYLRGGYIHPVYSPKGKIVTNHLDLSSHPHHSGIWSAWPSTEYDGRNPDFWNVHLNTGRVDYAGDANLLKNGPVYSGFHSTHHFIDLTGSENETALIEGWTVRVYGNRNSDQFFIFDLETQQQARDGKPLKLPQYRYGGVGFRGNKEWNDPEKVRFLTSSGEGREADGLRVRWLAVYGEIGGATAGIVIMDHPSNLRYPQPVRIHPETPFVNFSPVKIGAMEIRESEPYQAKYRYITFDGDPDPQEIERMWNDFAFPPELSIIVP